MGYPTLVMVRFGGNQLCFRRQAGYGLGLTGREVYLHLVESIEEAIASIEVINKPEVGERLITRLMAEECHIFVGTRLYPIETTEPDHYGDWIDAIIFDSVITVSAYGGFSEEWRIGHVKEAEHVPFRELLEKAEWHTCESFAQLCETDLQRQVAAGHLRLRPGA